MNVTPNIFNKKKHLPPPITLRYPEMDIPYIRKWLLGLIQQESI